MRPKISYPKLLRKDLLKKLEAGNINGFDTFSMLKKSFTAKRKIHLRRMVEIHCQGWAFLSNFDSGNLGKVEEVVKPIGPIKNSSASSESIPEAYNFEFNVWTRPDCAGTEFENGNRTWFYFGMREGVPYSHVRINIVNLNKQCKMYAQGMTPVYKIVPGKSQWERIKERISFNMEEKQFTLSFSFRFGETKNQTVFFAFTYPYTYSDLLNHLSSVETNLRKNINLKDCTAEPKVDDIYYHRELLTHSLESRRIDLITISSHHGITKTREARLPNLFPDENVPRPFKFLPPKKVVFLSARVHPGETPSSFVMAGMINFLLSRDDPIALALRRHFVFKLIPMLNPDGVFRGHYRTDTRGVNLNRVYGSPSPTSHPSIYAARAMIRYCHYGMVVPEEEGTERSGVEDQISGLSLSRSQTLIGLRTSGSENFTASTEAKLGDNQLSSSTNLFEISNKTNMQNEDSGLFLYIDMHGHTSKKGIFMYGNYFDNINMKIESMLFPKLITLYSQHFLFDSCNFTEKNMYIRDKRDGSSREGCGRVAVYKATGLIRSYTLECNYNTGKGLNILPPPYRDPCLLERRPPASLIISPKYTPSLYEEVGKSVLSAILDLVGMHPNTRLVHSPYRSLPTVREVLRKRLLMEELSEREDGGPTRRFSGKTSRKTRLRKGLAAEGGRRRSEHQEEEGERRGCGGAGGAGGVLLRKGKPTTNPPTTGKQTRRRLHSLRLEESLPAAVNGPTSGTLLPIPSSATTAPIPRKPFLDKKKLILKKSKDDIGAGPLAASPNRKRIKKKCNIELSRRLSLDHRRKKLKPK